MSTYQKLSITFWNATLLRLIIPKQHCSTRPHDCVISMCASILFDCQDSLHLVVLLQDNTCLEIISTAFLSPHTNTIAHHLVSAIFFSKRSFPHRSCGSSRRPRSKPLHRLVLHFVPDESPQDVCLASCNPVHNCPTPTPFCTTVVKYAVDLVHQSSAFYLPRHILPSAEIHAPPRSFIGILHLLLQTFMHLPFPIERVTQDRKLVRKR